VWDTLANLVSAFFAEAGVPFLSGEVCGVPNFGFGQIVNWQLFKVSVMSLLL